MERLETAHVSQIDCLNNDDFDDVAMMMFRKNNIPHLHKQHDTKAQSETQ